MTVRLFAAIIACLCTDVDRIFVCFSFDKCAMTKTRRSPTGLEKLPHSNMRRRNPIKRWSLSVGLFILIYLLIAYIILPFGWERYATDHPTLDDNPRITETSDGHPGDPLNVALIGSESAVKAIISAAKWYEANALGVRSDIEIAVDTVTKRQYDEAPVSSLYLFGRKEDLAFEQPVGDDPRKRNHVRLWLTGKTDKDGQPIWIGSASYDERVGLSHTTGQVTHHIAPDVDTERDRLFDDLQSTGELAEKYVIPGFHKVLKGINGGGDPWYTDGALWVGIINSAEK
jgi:hypothetical protein